MADIVATIETETLRLMQAWMHGDAAMLKKLIHRDCTLMIGTSPPQLLDRPSLIAALDGGLQCRGFRLGDALITRHGKAVWWSAVTELELKLGRTEWAGSFLMTDLWRKYRFSGWKLAERSLAPTAVDEDHKLASHLRKLQLWR